MNARDELEQLRATLTDRHNASLDNIKKAAAHDIHVNQMLRAERGAALALLAEAREFADSRLGTSSHTTLDEWVALRDRIDALLGEGEGHDRNSRARS